MALSEKAANLARIIRSEKALFDLLVEEKKGEQKNKRFLRDFKTLGDVLIQEMIRHDIAQKVNITHNIPQILSYIYHGLTELCILVSTSSSVQWIKTNCITVLRLKLMSIQFSF